MMRAGVGLLIGAAVLAAHGQTPAGIESGLLARIAPARMSPVQEPARGVVVREIDDLGTGTRWLLMRDAGRPGGPDRLVPVQSSAHRAARNNVEIEPASAELRPVLHAGDRLIVEENSPRVEARFEAVALGPARLGSVLAVRLTVGGGVVRAVALGPGRAMLQVGTEARP
jgi:hypothetical protein